MKPPPDDMPPIDKDEELRAVVQVLWACLGAQIDRLDRLTNRVIALERDQPAHNPEEILDDLAKRLKALLRDEPGVLRAPSGPFDDAGS